SRAAREDHADGDERENEIHVARAGVEKDEKRGGEHGEHEQFGGERTPRGRCERRVVTIEHSRIFAAKRSPRQINARRSMRATVGAARRGTETAVSAAA